jgi:hypothetical protein
MTEAVSLERRFANFRAAQAVREAPVPLGPSHPIGRRTTTVGAERLAVAVGGRVETTPRGTFVVVESPSTLLPVDRERLASLPGQPPANAPLLCLDTETTGLATAAGTLAFLVGLGWWEGSRFRQVQLLLPDHADEPALLAELAARIPRNGWLVTYNGRGFDWPLLVARFRMAGWNPPLHDGHLDLLPLVRRVFRHRMTDARLASVEAELLGLRRHGDIPGWEIPGRYLDYLRFGDPGPIVDIVRHNDEDVRSLGRLLVHVDQGYADAERWAEAPAGDLAGLARAFAGEGRHDDALRCLDAALLSAAAPARAAVPARGAYPEPSSERARLAARESRSDDDAWWSPRRPPDFGGRPGRYATVAAWDAAESSRRDAPWTETRMLAERARLLRRLGRFGEAEIAWAALAATRGTIGALAWVEVAKIREHRLGDVAGAIEAATAALRLAERQAWLGRPLARLESSLAHRLARLGARRMRSRTASRVGTPSTPGASTTSDAAAAPTSTSAPRDGSTRAASIAARNTSPAPVGSTTWSEGTAV